MPHLMSISVGSSVWQREQKYVILLSFPRRHTVTTPLQRPQLQRLYTLQCLPSAEPLLRHWVTQQSNASENVHLKFKTLLKPYNNVHVTQPYEASGWSDYIIAPAQNSSKDFNHATPDKRAAWNLASFSLDAGQVQALAGSPANTHKLYDIKC